MAGDSAGVLKTGRITTKSEREVANRLGSISQRFGSGGMMMSAYVRVGRQTDTECLSNS